MSILVEVADRADVTVEGVVRVLTRAPVSNDVKERVLAVLDELDAEQTRVVARFALAAVHDVFSQDEAPTNGIAGHGRGNGRHGNGAPDFLVAREAYEEPPAPEPPDAAGHDGGAPEEPSPEPPPEAQAEPQVPFGPPPTFETPATFEPSATSESPPTFGPPPMFETPATSESPATVERPATLDQPEELALSARLGLLLEELVRSVGEVRRESQADRQERLDDLAMLVDLMTAGWQGVDRRLGRIERVISRLESARPAAAPLPYTPPQPPVQPAPAPAAAHTIEAEPVRLPPPVPPVAAPPPAEPAVEGPEPRRGWPPVVTTILFVLAVAGVMLALDFLPSRADGPSLQSVPEGTTISQTTGAPGPTTTATATPRSSTTVRTTPRSTGPAPQTRPARTSSAPTATVAAPPVTVAKKPAPAKSTPTKPAPTTAPPAHAVTPPPTTTAGPVGFAPSREFVWAPVDGADYYAVQFFRNDKKFFNARPNEARVIIPKSVTFLPGLYHWIVRPGFGKPAENRVGAPVVDSSFLVGNS